MFSHLESRDLKSSLCKVFFMVAELVPDDDVDGGLLPEVAGLLLGECGHGGGTLLFMGVPNFLVFLMGDASSSKVLFSLLWLLVVMVWVLAWCGVCLAGVLGGGGMEVGVTVSRWTWARSWWYRVPSWGAGPRLVSGGGVGGGGAVVTVSMWTLTWPWWCWGLPWGAGPRLVSGCGG